MYIYIYIFIKKLTSADSLRIVRPSGVKLSAPVIKVSYSLSPRSGNRLIALFNIQSIENFIIYLKNYK